MNVNINIVDYEKRHTHTELLRWSTLLDKAEEEYANTSEEDPKRQYLHAHLQECKLMLESYRQIHALQDDCINSLKDLYKT